MKHPKYFAAAILVALLIPSTASGQSRSVAITVDDLPYAGPLLDLPNYSADAINNRLLAAFARHHVQVTGFVIEQSVGEKLDRATGTRVLQHWIANGLDLGNHTYSHPDFNNRSIEQIEEEITRGEATFATLMKAAGRNPEFFRYPMLHTGDANMDAIAGQMGLSRQTLLRRLKSEGTTFEKVLDGLRHKLALSFLSGKKVSVNETAYLVGFSDPASFSRAFKRWTGSSPKAMRHSKGAVS